MCGVYAELGVSPAHVLKRVQRMQYRGTKDAMVLATPHGCVGHVRLPIVGLSDSYSQPVRRDGWSVAFVGEVLDFRDSDPGAESDVPIVVDRWIERGPSALVDSDGFWSIVALQEDDNSIHAVVDYLAQKPLYYINGIGRTAVSSEIHPLLEEGMRLDEVYLSACLKWGYCPDPTRTPYRDIKKVQPGEYVRLHRYGTTVREIVDPLQPRSMTMRDFRTEIEAAVRRRVLSSDVPVACLVSGGLDSSIVYSIARNHADVVPYYASTKPTTIEEAAAHAEEQLRVLKVLEGRGLPRSIDWSDVTIEEALQYMQEPIDLGSLVPQIALARAIDETVVLTGDGADECFGGYGRSMRYDSQYSDVFQELPMWHLPRLDRVMMRHRIEVRSPFLARRVVEGALGLPWSQRRDKSYLREMFRFALPKGLADAPKVPLRRREVDRAPEEYRKTLVETFRNMSQRRDGIW